MSSIELFSPDFNTWGYVADIPGEPRLGIAAGVVGDALILVGGYGKRDDSSPGGDISASVVRFDILAKR